MVTAPHRTDTSYFVVVILIVAAGIAWASVQRRAGESATTTPATASSTTTSSTTPTAAWTGELIAVRDSAIIARTSGGLERTIYTAPSNVALGRVLPPVNGTIYFELVSQESVQVYSVETMEGPEGRRTIASLGSELPRPNTGSLDGSFAQIVSSNAERNFGFTVNLVDGQTVTKLHHSTTPISAMAWRADGEVLAIANQTSLVLITLTAGDTQTIELTSPIASLSWRGADLILAGPSGAFHLAGGDQALASLDLDPSATADLVALNEQQFVWRTTEGQLIEQTLGSLPVPLGVSADQLIGLSQLTGFN